MECNVRETKSGPGALQRTPENVSVTRERRARRRADPSVSWTLKTVRVEDSLINVSRQVGACVREAQSRSPDVVAPLHPPGW